MKKNKEYEKLQGILSIFEDKYKKAMGGNGDEKLMWGLILINLGISSLFILGEKPDIPKIKMVIGTCFAHAYSDYMIKEEYGGGSRG